MKPFELKMLPWNVAFGAGLQIALAADVRFAAPDSRLSIMEIKWGLIPDLAITTTARHIVRADKLKELAYTGRIVSGNEAHALGLVTELHGDPLDAAFAAAAAIAARSPDAIRAVKALFNEGLEQAEPGALALEARLQGQLIGAANQREAVQANLEKRPPRFKD